MPLVEQVFERHQLAAGFVQGVHTVVDGDVPHIVGREDLLNVEPGVELVSAQTGQVLGDDDGHIAVLTGLLHNF